MKKNFVFIILILSLFSIESIAITIDVGNTLNQSLLDGGHGLATKLPPGINHSQASGVLSVQAQIPLPGTKSPLKSLDLQYSSSVFRNKGMGIGFDWALPRLENKCTKKGCFKYFHFKNASHKLIETEPGVFREENLNFFIEGTSNRVTFPDGLAWTFTRDGMPLSVMDTHENEVTFKWNNSLLVEINIYDRAERNPIIFSAQLSYSDCNKVSTPQPSYWSNGALYNPNLCLKTIDLSTGESVHFNYKKDGRDWGRYLESIQKKNALFSYLKAEYSASSLFPAEEKNFCPSKIEYGDHLLIHKGQLRAISDRDLIHSLKLDPKNAFYDYETLKYSYKGLAHARSEDVYYVSTVDLNSDRITDLIVYPVRNKPRIFMGTGTGFIPSNSAIDTYFPGITPRTLEASRFGDFNGDEQVDLFICSFKAPSILLQGQAQIWRPDSVQSIQCSPNDMVVDLNSDSYDDIILENGIIFGGPQPQYYDKSQNLRDIHRYYWEMAKALRFDGGNDTSFITKKELYLAFSKARQATWNFVPERGYSIYNDRIKRTDRTADKSGVYSVLVNGQCSSEVQVPSYEAMSRITTPFLGTVDFIYENSFQGLRLTGELRSSKKNLQNETKYIFEKPAYNDDNEFLGYATIKIMNAPVGINESIRREGSVNQTQYLIDKDAIAQNRAPIVGLPLNEYTCSYSGCTSEKWTQLVSSQWTTIRPSFSQKLFFSFTPLRTTSLKSSSAIESTLKEQIDVFNITQWGPSKITKTSYTQSGEYSHKSIELKEYNFVAGKFQLVSESTKNDTSESRKEYKYHRQPGTGQTTIKSFNNGKLMNTHSLDMHGRLIWKENRFGLRTSYSYYIDAPGHIEIQNAVMREYQKLDPYGRIIESEISTNQTREHFKTEVKWDFDGLLKSINKNGQIISYERGFHSGVFFENVSVNGDLDTVSIYDGFGEVSEKKRSLGQMGWQWSINNQRDSHGTIYESSKPIQRSFSYDLLGREIRNWNLAGQREYTIYAGLCSHKLKIDQGVHSTDTSSCSDFSLNPIYVRTPSPSEHHLSYDDQLRVKAIQSPAQKTNLQFAYNEDSTVSTATLNQEILYSKNLNGLQVDLGVDGVQTLDSSGRLVQEKNSLNTTTKTLNLAGQTLEEDSTFYKFQTEFTALNQPRSKSYFTKDWKQHFIQYSYDKNMRLKNLSWMATDLDLQWSQNRLTAVLPYITGLSFDQNDILSNIRYASGLTFNYTTAPSGDRLGAIEAKNSNSILLKEKYKWLHSMLQSKEILFKDNLEIRNYPYTSNGTIEKPSNKQSTPIKIERNRVSEMDGKKVLYGTDGKISGVISGETSGSAPRSSLNDEYYFDNTLHYIKGSFIQYIRVGTNIVGAAISAPPKANAPPGKFYPILTDQVGSVRAIFDEKGQLLVYRDYDEWGNYTKVETFGPEGRKVNDLIRYDFANLVRPQGSSYLIAEKRIYAPAQGQWLTLDPKLLTDPLNFAHSHIEELDGLAYAKNNPLFFIDPSGLYTKIHLLDTGNREKHIALSINDEPKMGFYATGDSALKLLWGVKGSWQVEDKSTPVIESVILNTTQEQETKLRQQLELRTLNPPEYNVLFNNCSQEVSNTLRSADIDVPSKVYPVKLIEALKVYKKGDK